MLADNVCKLSKMGDLWMHYDQTTSVYMLDCYTE